MKTAALCLALCAIATPALAALTPAAIGEVRAAAPPNARAPLGLKFETDQGRSTTLGQALAGKPGLLIFADYTCTSLCGPALVLTKAGLEASRLKPNVDYKLVVVGLNPKDGPAAALKMRRDRLADDPAIDGATSFLIGDPATTRAATGALGYHYVYDAEQDQYAHPAVAYVLRPDGRVQSVAPEIALAGPALTAALLSARSTERAPGNLITAGLHILCYGFDPAHGIYDGAAIAGLRWGSLGLFAVGALTLLLLNRRRREPRP